MNNLNIAGTPASYIKKGALSFWYFWTNPFPVLSFSECLVCVCVLFIYTIPISIICVSQEEPSLIYEFYKWIILGKKRH